MLLPLAPLDSWGSTVAQGAGQAGYHAWPNDTGKSDSAVT